MAGRLEANTDAMQRFVNDLKNPDTKVAQPMQSSACASGLSSTLSVQLQHLGDACAKNLQQVDQGFTSYKDIVTTCRNDYLRSDEVHALEIARTMHHDPNLENAVTT